MAIKRYANQIIIVRRSEPEKDQTHPYTKLSNEAKKYAAQHLGHYGYKLWSFMPELVIDNEEWAFSPSQFKLMEIDMSSLKIQERLAQKEKFGVMKLRPTRLNSGLRTTWRACGMAGQ